MSYDKNKDYSSLMESAANKGNMEAAAKYEQLRNDKIEGEGLTQYGKTSKYAAYLPTYQSNYSSALDQAARDVSGISDFSYDPNTDENWKNYQNQYVRNANRAVRDTLAETAGTTGGLASSYGTQAAAQAGQNYLAQLNDGYTDMYHLALSAWQANNSAKQSKLSALQSLNESQYNIYNADRQSINDQKQQAFTNAMQKWQAAGILDAASAKILGIAAGTKYSDYAQWKETLANQWKIAQLQAAK